MKKEITTKPFADLIKQYKFALRQKPLWHDAIKEIEHELKEIYGEQELVNVFINLFFDKVEEQTGGRMLHEYKKNHFTKVMDRSLGSLLEWIDTDQFKLVKTN